MGILLEKDIKLTFFRQLIAPHLCLKRENFWLYITILERYCWLGIHRQKYTALLLLLYFCPLFRFLRRKILIQNSHRVSFLFVQRTSVFIKRFFDIFILLFIIYFLAVIKSLFVFKFFFINLFTVITRANLRRNVEFFLMHN